MRYEYKVVTAGSPLAAEEELRRLGRRGWRVVELVRDIKDSYFVLERRSDRDAEIECLNCGSTVTQPVSLSDKDG